MKRMIASIELAAQPAEWCPLVPLGTWKGHPSGVEKITPERAASIEAFYKAHNAGQADPVVDYNHSSLLAAAGRIAPDQAKAAGWLKALELRDGIPHGRIEWTPNALAAIQAREFRYISPVLVFDGPDPVSGERVPCYLDSIGLTNRPFFRELPAVANAADDAAAILSDPSDPPHTRPVAWVGFAEEVLAGKAEPIADVAGYPAELCVVLNAAPEAQRRVEFLPGLDVVLGRQPGRSAWLASEIRFDAARWPQERAAAWLRERRLAANFQETPVDLKELSKLIGLPESSTEEQAKARIAELTKPAPAQPLIAANVAEVLGVPHDATIDAVKARLAVLSTPSTTSTPDVWKGAIANSLGLGVDAALDAILGAIGKLGGSAKSNAAEQLVDKAISDRKVPPANKAFWLNAATADLDGTAKVLGAMTAMVNSQPVITGAAGETGQTAVVLTPEQIKLAAQCGIKPEDVAATIAAHNAK